MFQEAQERYRSGQLFGHHNQNNYVRSLLQQYGDAGRPVNLPQQSQADYERALQHHNTQKQHYINLENRNKQIEERLIQTRKENQRLRKFLNSLEFLDDNTSTDATSGAGHGVDSSGGDSGHGVLPPEDRARQDDTDAREPEAIISSKEAKDERPNARSRRAPRNDPQPIAGEEGSEVRTQRSDAGGALPDATDGPEPDVGGPASEHGVEE